MDVRWVALLGKGAGYVMWLCFPSRRRIVARNLRITINPLLREKELAPLIRKNIVLTCMNFISALKVGVMTEKELLQSVELLGKEEFEDAGTDGHTGIACIPHAGNWEILARIRPLFTKVEHFGSMYRKLRNPILEKLVYDLRTGYGCEMYSKEAGLRKVIRTTRKGGLIGILSDQFTSEGVHVPYFGKVTGTTPFPSMLHGMCKSKLFTVHTKNTGLGRWQAVLNGTVTLDIEGKDKLAAQTIAINRSLEEAQNVSILDGFWMHHRWKIFSNFGLQHQEDLAATALPYVRLPFRILVALPDNFEEAILCVPALYILQQSRYDAEISIICQQEQLGFWQAQSGIVSHILISDGSESIAQQLDAEEVYAKGPFDYLFMWSERGSLLRQLRKKLSPIYISGFAENALSKQFRTRRTSGFSGPVRHRFRDYLALLEKGHALDVSQWQQYPRLQQEGEGQLWIAPFSSLGSCEEQRTTEQWQEIISQLPQGKKWRLLALPADKQRAETLATQLELPLDILSHDEIRERSGSSSVILAVDGIIPQLAAYAGARLVVLMASRLSKRYRVLTPRAHILYQHSSCHPCYRTNCDAAHCCITEIKAHDIVHAIQEHLN